MFAPVELPLKGIDWVIVGGGSDILANPFHVEWALAIRSQCRRANVAFFLKQLGRNPFYQAARIKLKNKHGGDWSEWHKAWRTRQIPSEFRSYQARLVP